MDELWRKRIRWLGYLSIPGGVGFALLLGAMIGVEITGAHELSGPVVVFLILGVVLFIPFGVWATLVPFLHWAERYRGRHRMLWICLLAFETSG